MMPDTPYQWQKKDKIYYAVSLLPFLLAFCGTIYLLAYGILILIHLALFMPSQCEKCSYNDACPGGIMWQKCPGGVTR